jgi:hypothetical protein
MSTFDGAAERDCPGMGSLFVMIACACALGMFGILRVTAIMVIVIIARNLFLLFDLNIWYHLELSDLLYCSCSICGTTIEHVYTMTQIRKKMIYSIVVL